MKITYKSGNITGEAIFYGANDNWHGINEKEQEKKKTRFFRLLKVKKYKFDYQIN